MPYFRRLFVFSTLALSLLLTGLGFQLWKEHRALQHADLAERANIALDSLVKDLRKNVDILETGLEGIRFNERAFTNQLQRLSLPSENLIFVFENGGLKYWSENKVLPDTTVYRFAAVVLLRAPGARRVRSVLVLPDSMDAEAFRQLRVWLRWRSSVSRGAS